jgi:hypothetical protein
MRRSRFFSERPARSNHANGALLVNPGIALRAPGMTVVFVLDGWVRSGPRAEVVLLKLDRTQR